MTNEDLRNILIKASLRAVLKQHDNGSFEAGCNGPYKHSETPVRNTAHWLSVFCYAIKSNKLNLQERKYIENSSHKAVNYLLSNNSRPNKKSFFCRSSKGKDSCNGLIGQAWTIEGLIRVYNELNIEEARNVALEVFFLHPFDYEKGIWKRVEVDGNILGFDFTFNHQLWFAAIAIQLEDARAEKMVKRFLDLVGQNVDIYSDGILFHATNIVKYNFLKLSDIPSYIIALLREFQKPRLKKTLYIKSVGYHSFNLYAYAILKKYFPSHGFWKSEIFLKMISITNNKAFLDNLDKGPYGWPYNPTGIELAYVGKIFSLGDGYVQKWLSMQYKKTYDSVSDDLMIKGSADITTSSARIYEATRIADKSL
ncbi:hypothetical protein N9H11_04210 [Candidatus Pelagibacter ubique]|nr:hypothetical protein [Candidatus Pelagibacter ubique]